MTASRLRAHGIGNDIRDEKHETMKGLGHR